MSTYATVGNGQQQQQSRFDSSADSSSNTSAPSSAGPHPAVAAGGTSQIARATLEETCADLNRQVSEFLEKDGKGDEAVKAAQVKTKEALEVFEEALGKFSLDELSLSYNGGKDCLVLLVVYLAALYRYHTTNNIAFPTSLRSIYIQTANPFAAVDEFVQFSSKQYHLSLTTLNAPMKQAFEVYLNQNPRIKAIFVGTRRTDPHGASLTAFDPTDGGWPSFVRIHPVLDWRYRDIWAFIRHLDIAYCSLYDFGYTSLGGTTDTHPNPALAVVPSQKNLDGVIHTQQQEESSSSPGKPKYRPAYELLEDNEERLGRDWGKGGAEK